MFSIFQLPRTGTLELDYVSVARPRYDAVAATPGRLRRLLEGLKLVPRGSMRRARQMAMQQRREAMAEEERQRKVKAHQKADDTPAAASPTSFSMRAKLKVGESRASLVKCVALRRTALALCVARCDSNAAQCTRYLCESARPGSTARLLRMLGFCRLDSCSSRPLARRTWSNMRC